MYCGNNAKASVLLDGTERVGRPSECIQRGFGAALHQPVKDVEAFVRTHGGPYEKLIDPQLWFKNKAPPLVCSALLFRCASRKAEALRGLRVTE